MIVELKRALAPDEVGVEEPCGICEVPYVTGVVSAHVTGGSTITNTVCPSCVEYFGQRNPERFPTIEEFEEANERFTEPVYESVEEIMRLEENDDPAIHEAYRASWLSRA